MSTDLAAFLDRQAIVDLAVEYCWALDSNEFDRLREVFTPDGSARYAGVEHDGVDAIIAKCSAALGPLDDSQHMVTNHQVEIDGDRATARCYFQAQHVRRAAEGGPNYIVAGRYEDELVRTAAGWRIARRVLTPMWTEGNVRVIRP